MIGNGIDQVIGAVLQLPVVMLFGWFIFRMLDREKAARDAYLEALDKERASREVTNGKLHTTLVGLTGGVSDLTHAVTELRADVRNEGRA